MIWLSTNMRDESNVLEWIAYHFIIGFDRVFIIDHASKIPIQSLINKYKFRDRITVIRLEADYLSEGNFKKHILNNIVLPFMKSSQKKVDWFIHLDGDEYINLNGNFKTVRGFLNKYPPQAQIIALNWVCFGSSFYDKHPNGLVIKNFIRCAPKCPKMEVKCFVKPKHIRNLTQVHYWNVQNPKLAFDANGNHWNVWPFNKKSRGPKDRVYINHYQYQSYEKYMQRKGTRKNDLGKMCKNILNRPQLHSKYNNIVNKSLVPYTSQINRFLINQKT